MDVFMAFPLIIMALAIVAIFGTGALQAGDNEAAARHFGAAIAADPHSGALQRNLASAWRALGDEARELEALDAALAIDRRALMAWIRTAEQIGRAWGRERVGK